MARQKAPCLSHAKSRGGCQRCKARKVKCSEDRPSCASCLRHKVPCVYIPPSAKASSSRRKSLASTVSAEARAERPGSTPPYSASPFDMTESAERRVLELKLFHQFYSVTAQQSFLSNHDPPAREMWTVHAPQMALQHNFLLYSILSVAALHLATVHPERSDMADAHRKYFNATVSEHRRVLLNINQSNADAICMTGILISFQAFMLLRQGSSPGHYTLPLQWFRLANGNATVFKQAWEYISESGKVMAAITATPNLSKLRDKLFDERNRLQFSVLLTQSPEIEEQNTYEQALSYIGFLDNFINNGEGKSQIRRLIMNFAVLIPSRFTQLLEERQPQAIAILAHFFALAKAADDAWWMHGTAEREVYGLQSILPDEYQWAMTWPLQRLESLQSNVTTPMHLSQLDLSLA